MNGDFDIFIVSKNFVNGSYNNDYRTSSAHAFTAEAVLGRNLDASATSVHSFPTLLGKERKDCSYANDRFEVVV